LAIVKHLNIFSQHWPAGDVDVVRATGVSLMSVWKVADCTGVGKMG